MAAGTLLGTAFAHMLPEAIERLGFGPKLTSLLLASFVGFFVLEKAVGVYLERGLENRGEQHTHSHSNPVIEGQEGPRPGITRPMITNLLTGAAIHSFIDGMAIATAFSAETRLGLITTVAVLLHETPHHIGDVGILIHSGVPVRRAVSLNLMVGSVAAIGALLVLLLGSRFEKVITLLLPFTAANFIYIASASLMPELQRERGLRKSLMQVLLLLLGSSMMWLVSILSEHS
jgi:zinc and cadmium transporter